MNAPPIACRSGHPGLVAVALVAALLASASCGGADVDAEAETDAPVAYEAEDATTGDAVTVADLRGAPVLLSSWATWCAPCRKELPQLQSLHEQDRKDGLQVVMVNVDDAGKDVAEIEQMARELGITMPQWRDGDQDFTVVFNALGVPMSVLLDEEGVLVRKWYGAVDADSQEFSDEVAEALEAGPQP